jgi:hypothetical protein
MVKYFDLALHINLPVGLPAVSISALGSVAFSSIHSMNRDPILLWKLSAIPFDNHGRAYFMALHIFLFFLRVCHSSLCKTWNGNESDIVELD